MAKTTFLQIRLTPEDRARVAKVAAADHLDASTWARRALLQAVGDWERQQSDRGSAAELQASTDSSVSRTQALVSDSPY